jgi:hypothetical protein
MGNSYNYSLKDLDGLDIGHLLIVELPELQIKVAHLYNLDIALPHVFDNFPYDRDFLSIAKELLMKSGNDKPFQIEQGRPELDL